MTYEEALAAIHERHEKGKKNGIENMRILMARLGDPQDQLKFVHIVGTNGKGSAAAMTASVLQEAGYKTGLSMSPYVVDFRERMRINGEMIPKEALAEGAQKVLEAAKEMERAAEGTPTEFEVVNAIALWWFAKKQCDFVCLEAGIGGRDDATNVIRNTLVTYVMHMGLDHTEQLGYTIEEITMHKCGVFKNQCAVISYPDQPAGAKEVIRYETGRKGCELTVPELEDIHLLRKGLFDNRIDYGGYELNVPFPGVHQAENAAVVIEGCLALWRQGYEISDEAIIKGIEKASIPGRIEVISSVPLIVVDGSHNEDGAKALAATLAVGRRTGMTAIVGMVRGKDHQSFLEALRPHVRHIIAVEPNTPRALPADALADLAEPLFSEVETALHLKEALYLAGRPEEGLLICGSFYLAGEAKAYFS